ncbi:hypothetical protein AYI70_g11636 [Smittium culicis]|uniref:Activator of Hsp90 ATPase AHSA1-like N-terminal domain-containing protein n=1 Tax=Smittium culicis TaxID=133412 RepID=A0A1R1X0Y0_9FUNG|nr:hypothetical protein AYI70_g11636 [Smittium culicis]
MSQANWKNVNNWHWTEKNCAEWAKKYFARSLIDIKYIGKNKEIVKITSVESVTGDADLNQRKGKILTLYDLEIKLKWAGYLDGDEEDKDKAIKGSLTIPEVAHDSEADDYVFDVRLDNDTKAGWALKELVRTELSKLLVPEFAKFPNAMIQENLGDVYINDSSFVANNSKTPKIKSHINKEEEQPHVKAFKAGESGLTLSGINLNSNQMDQSKTSTVKLESEFMASASDIFDALLNMDKVKLWTRSSNITISPKPSTTFSLFGGNIRGQLEIADKDNFKIVQKWRNNSWQEHHYSTVTIELKQSDGSTKLHLTQIDVPTTDLDATKANWDNYYFKPIKTTFGWGFSV